MKGICAINALNAYSEFLYDVKYGDFCNIDEGISLIIDAINNNDSKYRKNLVFISKINKLNMIHKTLSKEYENLFYLQNLVLRWDNYYMRDVIAHRSEINLKNVLQKGEYNVRVLKDEQIDRNAFEIIRISKDITLHYKELRDTANSLVKTATYFDKYVIKEKNDSQWNKFFRQLKNLSMHCAKAKYCNQLVDFDSLKQHDYVQKSEFRVFSY